MVSLFNFGRDKGRDDASGKDGGFFKGLFEKDGAKAEKVEVEKKAERVILRGKVPRREDAERMIVRAGNNKGVAEVESHLEIEEDDKTPEATMYEVKSGDTLSKIAKAHYGDAAKYPVIFEANRPMLKDPDEIYPGQVLRIPPESKAMA